MKTLQRTEKQGTSSITVIDLFADHNIRATINLGKIVKRGVNLLLADH